MPSPFQQYIVPLYTQCPVCHAMVNNHAIKETMRSNNEGYCHMWVKHIVTCDICESVWQQNVEAFSDKMPMITTIVLCETVREWRKRWLRLRHSIKQRG